MGTDKVLHPDKFTRLHDNYGVDMAVDSDEKDLTTLTKPPCSIVQSQRCDNIFRDRATVRFHHQWAARKMLWATPTISETSHHPPGTAQ
ncbi:hypothetical protein E2C01_053323 [Portunus trituberculatus]|uniref:Uncharacterized protein n=1 Tax=Portunus trituberculatus TaxID=210409 RepID=A0A5B7GQ08_PORTR|nr:hypothetical protein [Portunus trituberculatus]